MPHYFLHIRDGADLISDPEGSTLPNIEAARTLAVGSAREIISEDVLYGNPVGLDREFQIDDESGRTLLKVSFRDALVFRTGYPAPVRHCS